MRICPKGLSVANVDELAAPMPRRGSRSPVLRRSCSRYANRETTGTTTSVGEAASDITGADSFLQLARPFVRIESEDGQGEIPVG